MTASFEAGLLKGKINAPPSKSIAHRLLIGAALSKKNCTITGIDFSEDILATIDCLRALGAEISIDSDTITVSDGNFMDVSSAALNCRESGSTLRFFIPLALCIDKPITFFGAERLFERPLDVYEKLAKENGFVFEKTKNSLLVSGKLEGGEYKIDGSVSSQFITGLIFALVYLRKRAKIAVVPPFESRSYVNLTLSALKSFGADVKFTSEYEIKISPAEMRAFSGKVEADFSNAAFLDAFNALGSDIKIENLNEDSLQGDKIYREYFKEIEKGVPTLDVSDCPDLAPVLIALSSMKNGATLIGTDRLKAKESDRGAAMHEELKKLGGGLIFGDNTITIPKQNLKYNNLALEGHNDHRIVMALSVILSKIGGEILGAEAVKKSYPAFFNDIKKLGAKVVIK